MVVVEDLREDGGLAAAREAGEQDAELFGRAQVSVKRLAQPGFDVFAGFAQVHGLLFGSIRSRNGLKRTLAVAAYLVGGEFGNTAGEEQVVEAF